MDYRIFPDNTSLESYITEVNQNLVAGQAKLSDFKEESESSLTKSLTDAPSFNTQWKRHPPREINLLTLHTRDKSVCEICENWGIFQCGSCKATYYCCMKHLEIDEELHRDVCAIMKVLRTPIEFSACPATRERMRAQYFLRVDELYRYTLLRAQTEMIKGKYDLGIAASRSSLKTTRMAHGDTIQSILPMAVLTECYLKKKKMTKAQQCLAKCLALEMALDDITCEVRAAIRRVEGLYSLKIEDFPNAKHCFAEQIYLYSHILDPDHIANASGYQNLGNIFLKKNKSLTARSLVRRTIDIWSMYISAILEQDINKTTGGSLSLMFNDLPRKKGEDLGPTRQARRETAKLFTIKGGRFGHSNLSYSRNWRFYDEESSCYAMLKKIGNDIEVKPEDYIEIDCSQAGLHFINHNYIEARKRFYEGINKCSAHGLKGQPIHQRLVKYRRECDLHIRAAKKKTGRGSRSEISYPDDV